MDWNLQHCHGNGRLLKSSLEDEGHNSEELESSGGSTESRKVGCHGDEEFPKIPQYIQWEIQAKRRNYLDHGSKKFLVILRASYFCRVEET